MSRVEDLLELPVVVARREEILDEHLTEYNRHRTVGESTMKLWSRTSSSEQALHTAASAMLCVRIPASDRLAKQGYPTFGRTFNPEVGT